MSDKKKKVALLLNYDLKEVFEKCTSDQTKELIFAMINYDQSGILPEFSDDILKFIWIPIRQDLDKKRANHEKTSAERAKAGAIGGRGNKKGAAKGSTEESKKSNSFSEKQIETEKAKKANHDSDPDDDEGGLGESKKSNSFLGKQSEAKKAKYDSDPDDDEGHSDESKKSNSFSEKQIETEKAKKADYDSGFDTDEGHSDESKKSNNFLGKQSQAKKAKKAKKADCDCDCDSDCDHDNYLNEMNTTATTGAREESTMRKIGEQYRQAFGALDDDKVTKLGSLVISYGARDVVAAIETAAQREPPPEHPPNYIAKVCADWLEQRERLSGM